MPDPFLPGLPDAASFCEVRVSLVVYRGIVVPWLDQATVIRGDAYTLDGEYLGPSSRAFVVNAKDCAWRPYRVPEAAPALPRPVAGLPT